MSKLANLEIYSSHCLPCYCSFKSNLLGNMKFIGNLHYITLIIIEENSGAYLELWLKFKNQLTHHHSFNNYKQYCSCYASLQKFNQLISQVLVLHKNTWPRLRCPVDGSTSSSPVERTAIIGVGYTCTKA